MQIVRRSGPWSRDGERRWCCCRRRDGRRTDRSSGLYVRGSVQCGDRQFQRGRSSRDRLYGRTSKRARSQRVRGRLPLLARSAPARVPTAIVLDDWALEAKFTTRWESVIGSTKNDTGSVTGPAPQRRPRLCAVPRVGSTGSTPQFHAPRYLSVQHLSSHQESGRMILFRTTDASCALTTFS